MQVADDDTALSRVSTVLVRALVGVVQQRGVSPQVLLGPAVEAIYAEPAERFVSRAEFQALLAHAIHLTGDPALGLDCGLTASEASFGLMSPLIGHAPTLRRALELTAQFQSLLLDGVRVQLARCAGMAQLRCELENHVAADRSFVEFMLAGFTRMLLSFGCSRTDIHAVSFEYARPAYYHSYARAFGGAERFARPYTGIEFAACALDRAHLHSDCELHRLVLAKAEQHLQRLWRPRSCAERVRALIQDRPASQLPDMVVAARALGLSVRSLRRHLEDEGTSYRELTQTILCEAARSMLRDPAFTLQTIGHALGFSSATAFHRAFRRWAQLTPAEYRSEFFGVAHADDSQPA